MKKITVVKLEYFIPLSFQQSPYPSLSDDVPEEKLDDSNLNWDAGLEFDDEFQLSQVSPLSAMSGRRSPEKTRPRDRRVSSVSDFYIMD